MAGAASARSRGATLAALTMLSVRIARKSYRTPQGDERLVLRDLQLDVGAGEFVALVGPSGCGKSTLLNIVAGLDRAYEGRVKFTGPEPRIGYVFQNPRLLPWRTVLENIRLALPKSVENAAVDELLRTTDLDGHRDAYPERLSLGLSRRVALVRAFAIQPDVLLMDEPFVSLDAPTARRIRALLVRLREARPHTVLFVTHDLREAIAMADRLLFMCAAPATVTYGITVPIPRAQRSDEAAVEAFRQALIADHPDIRDWL